MTGVECLSNYEPMLTTQILSGNPAKNILSNGKVVAEVDRITPIDARSIEFANLFVKGDLSGDLEYNGKRIRILHVETILGMVASPAGLKGPVWQGVKCEVIS